MHIRWLRIILSLSIAAALSGCGVVQRIEGKAAYSVGALPLEFVDTSNPSDPNTVNYQWAAFTNSMPSSLKQTNEPKKDYLGFVASSSESRCADFLTSLVVASNGTHTGLDMMTTVFSALGTAFTPLATVHAMTAGATISSGWRANIDSDIYAQIAIRDMVTAIQGTYYKDIGNYVKALESANESNLYVPAELTKIQTIHAECTLASAQGTVKSSLKPPSQSGTGSVATETLAVTTPSTGAAVQDTITLSAQSPTLAGIASLPLVFVNQTETADKIATALANTINNDIGQSTISAKVADGATVTAASVLVSSQASDKVTWTAKANSGSRSKVGIVVSQPIATTSAPSTTPSGQPAAAVSSQ